MHDKAPTGPRGRTTAPRGSAVPTGPAAAVNSKLLVSNLHYDVTPKDLIVRAFPPFDSRPTQADTIYNQSVFGQIGTLVREPLLRVRQTTEFHLL